MKDAVGSVQSVLVLGGLSEIGLATARALVADRTRRVVLAVRAPADAEAAATDLRARGAIVEVVAFDATASPEEHGEFVERVFASGRDLDLALLAFGVLGDQAESELDARVATGVIETNFVGAVSVLVPLAGAMRAQGHGTIAVLSSVAAGRPRRANFTYGSSKAGLDAFAQGLGDALNDTGVQVTVIRPGFVRTKMTAAMSPAPFSVDADVVADAVVDAVRLGAHIVWVPKRLRWVMLVLRILPRRLFARLSSR